MQLAGKSSVQHPRSQSKRGRVSSVEKWDIFKNQCTKLRLPRVKSHGQLDPKNRETNCGWAQPEEHVSCHREIGTGDSVLFPSLCYHVAEPKIGHWWSPDNLRQAQMEDPTLLLGIWWCQQGTCPAKGRSTRREQGCLVVMESV